MDFELLLILVQLHNAQAFSLHNVKFLLFDVYRPDHLAYAFILLQTFLAIKRKFVPLLMATILASQAREFNIIPLPPYLFLIIPDENRTILIRQDVLSTIIFLPTILLPRILIPITMNYQIVGLSTQDIFTAILPPLMPSVELNFLFVIVAYFLPLLFIEDLSMIKSAYFSLTKINKDICMSTQFSFYCSHSSVGRISFVLPHFFFYRRSF